MNDFKYYLRIYGRIFLYLGLILLLGSFIYKWAYIKLCITFIVAFMWKIFLCIILLIFFLTSILGIIKSIFKR